MKNEHGFNTLCDCCRSTGELYSVRGIVDRESDSSIVYLNMRIMLCYDCITKLKYNIAKYILSMISVEYKG